MDFKTECGKLMDRYAAFYRAGNAEGCASVFASKAELYSPFGPLAKGRAAIEAVHREWVKEGADGKAIKVLSAGCNGDLGWCVARYSEGTTGNGSSVNILSRHPDGSWLITHSSLNEA